MVVRVEVAEYDAAITHHYPESLRNGVEVLDRVRGISTNLAQSAGL